MRSVESPFSGDNPDQRNAWAAGAASVAIAGNNLAPVNTTIFMGAWYPLAQAYFDPSHLSSELETNRFVGREWLVNEIDEYISTNRSGYFVIEADAGLGKTAFAWQLATRGAHPCHFTCIDARARRTDEAIRNITAQLIAAWKLDDLAPQGMLPPGSDRPIWLRKVLAAVAAERDRRNPNWPIVIVVDSLDEAERTPEEMPLGLPSILPERVFVVATMRTGTALPALRRPYRIRMLGADDTDNRWDMLRYLRIAAKTPHVADKLKGSSVTLQDFVEVLSDRCAGVWVYLHYVLSEIRYDQRQPDQIESLPADLESYYTQNFDAMRGEADWSTWYLPLLSTLCAITEPVGATEISQLGGIADESRISGFLMTRLRPFCQISHAHGHQLFRLYHSSLRDYLSGTMRAPTLSAAEYLRRELQDAAVSAHSRIADALVSEWGGLANCLPSLQASLSLAERYGGYGLRNLVRHLEHAKRGNEIERLLRCETDRRNLWFEAHEFQGDADGYLGDIERANRVLAPTSDESRPWMRAAADVRCALMAASVASRTAQIPLILIDVLARTGAWTQVQCLEHVRLIYDRRLRVEGYIRILPYLTGPRRAAGQREALDTARAIADDRDRAKVLVDIARLMPSDQKGSILAESRKIGMPGKVKWFGGGDWFNKDDYRAEVIALMADRLPRSLIASALNVVLRLYGRARDRALIALAPRLVGDNLRVALSAVQEFSDEGSRFRCLMAFSHTTAIAPFIEQAIDVVEGIRDPGDRATGLAAIARHLPADKQGKMLDAAIESARSLKNASARAIALVNASSMMEPSGYRRSIARDALSITLTITNLRVRIEVLAAGCQRLGGNEWLTAAEDALQEVRELQDLDLEVSAICILAPWLQRPAGVAAAKRALNIITPIHDHEAQIRALGALTRYLSGLKDLDIWELIDRIDDEVIRAGVLIELVQGRPQEFIEKALMAAASISDTTSRLRLVGALAAYVPAERISTLLEFVRETEAAAKDVELLHRLRRDGRHRVHLRRHLPADVLGRQVLLESYMLSHSTDSERMLDSDYIDFLLEGSSGASFHLAEEQADKRLKEIDAARLRVLQAIAPHLDESLGAEALAIARSMTHSGLRHEALMAVCANESVAERKVVILEVLKSISTRGLLEYFRLASIISDIAPLGIEENVANGLAQRFVAAKSQARLAFVKEALTRFERLPPGSLDRILVLLSRVDDLESRAQGMVALLPIAGRKERADIIQQIVRVAPEIEQREVRADVLIELVGDMRGEMRARTVASALKAALEISDEGNRVVAVARLLDYLEFGQRGEVLDEMLSIATTIYDVLPRVRALGVLIPYLPADVKARVLEDATSSAESIISDRSRSEVLMELAPMMDRVNFDRVVAAIGRFPSDEYRGKTLRALIPYLPQECTETVFAVALAIESEYWRAQVLIVIVPRLSLLQILDVCKATSEFNDSVDRVALLKVCMVAVRDRESVDFTRWNPFRTWAKDLDRSAILSVIESSDWWLAEIGGREAVLEAVSSILDVTRWWP